MNRIPAAWNRLTVGLIGVLAVLVGVAGLFSQVTVDPISDWIDRIDAGWFQRAADADWWTWVLLGFAVLAILWGLRLLGTLIRPQAVGPVLLDDAADGRTSIRPSLVADAVASHLGEQLIFDDVSVKALDDRGAKIVRIVVTASPTRSYREVVEALTAEVEQIRTALDGSDLHVQAMIEMAPVDG